MSLFASVGAGDIWANGAFDVSSSIDTVLERNDFTLEDVLLEDDLLQEVKTLNPKLITYLSKEEAIVELVRYLTESTEESASDVRKFKYPYLSCEIICCEVDDILDTLVSSSSRPKTEGESDSADTSGGSFYPFLDQLYSPFNDNKASSGLFDLKLSGYLEKITLVLLNKRRLDLIHYLNTVQSSPRPNPSTSFGLPTGSGTAVDERQGLIGYLRTLMSIHSEGTDTNLSTGSTLAALSQPSPASVSLFGRLLSHGRNRSLLHVAETLLTPPYAFAMKSRSNDNTCKDSTSSSTSGVRYHSCWLSSHAVTCQLIDSVCGKTAFLGGQSSGGSSRTNSSTTSSTSSTSSTSCLHASSAIADGEVVMEISELFGRVLERAFLCGLMEFKQLKHSQSHSQSQFQSHSQQQQQQQQQQLKDGERQQIESDDSGEGDKSSRNKSSSSRSSSSSRGIYHKKRGASSERHSGGGGGGGGGNEAGVDGDASGEGSGGSWFGVVEALSLAYNLMERKHKHRHRRRHGEDGGGAVAAGADADTNTCLGLVFRTLTGHLEGNPSTTTTSSSNSSSSNSIVEMGEVESVLPLLHLLSTLLKALSVTAGTPSTWTATATATAGASGATSELQSKYTSTLSFFLNHGDEGDGASDGGEGRKDGVGKDGEGAMGKEGAEEVAEAEIAEVVVVGGGEGPSLCHLVCTELLLGRYGPAFVTLVPPLVRFIRKHSYQGMGPPKQGLGTTNKESGGEDGNEDESGDGVGVSVGGDGAGGYSAYQQDCRRGQLLLTSIRLLSHLLRLLHECYCYKNTTTTTTTNNNNNSSSSSVLRDLMGRLEEAVVSSGAVEVVLASLVQHPRHSLLHHHVYAFVEASFLRSNTSKTDAATKTAAAGDLSSVSGAGCDDGGGVFLTYPHLCRFLVSGASPTLIDLAHMAVTEPVQSARSSAVAYGAKIGEAVLHAIVDIQQAQAQALSRPGQQLEQTDGVGGGAGDGDGGGGLLSRLMACEPTMEGIQSLLRAIEDEAGAAAEQQQQQQQQQQQIEQAKATATDSSTSSSSSSDLYTLPSILLMDAHGDAHGDGDGDGDAHGDGGSGNGSAQQLLMERWREFLDRGYFRSVMAESVPLCGLTYPTRTDQDQMSNNLDGVGGDSAKRKQQLQLQAFAVDDDLVSAKMGQSSSSSPSSSSTKRAANDRRFEEPVVVPPRDRGDGDSDSTSSSSTDTGAGVAGVAGGGGGSLSDDDTDDTDRTARDGANVNSDDDDDDDRYNDGSGSRRSGDSTYNGYYGGDGGGYGDAGSEDGDGDGDGGGRKSNNSGRQEDDDSVLFGDGDGDGDGGGEDENGGGVGGGTERGKESASSNSNADGFASFGTFGTTADNGTRTSENNSGGFAAFGNFDDNANFGSGFGSDGGAGSGESGSGSGGAAFGDSSGWASFSAFGEGATPAKADTANATGEEPAPSSPSSFGNFAAFSDGDSTGK